MATQGTARGLAVDTKHPDFQKQEDDWKLVRDCLDGERVIKKATTLYLPQPEGMKNEYQTAYDAYVERAHFPLICSYALQGALGVLLTKLPEFKLPRQLEYLNKTATKDGRSLHSLFLEMIIEIFTTGRAPVLVDILSNLNRFCFVPYKAEEFINWKLSFVNPDQQRISLAVLKELRKDPDQEDPFIHDTVERYRALTIGSDGNFLSELYDSDGHVVETQTASFRGRKLSKIPLINAGSINTSFNVQIIPLLAVANCAVKIYRKEADLSNSEFLSCNPTLIFSGADDDEAPNVVGSSVAIFLSDPQARGYYTRTDTQALTHVKTHISDLYDEAIRHGIALLEARKGVEAAEALRIRQATQVATIYSIYNSALSAIMEGLGIMCEWYGLPASSVSVDAPKALTQEIADSGLMKELVEGVFKKIVPVRSIHKYLLSTGLIDPTVTYDEYITELKLSNSVLAQFAPVEIEGKGKLKKEE